MKNNVIRTIFKLLLIIAIPILIIEGKLHGMFLWVDIYILFTIGRDWHEYYMDSAPKDKDDEGDDD